MNNKIRLQSKLLDLKIACYNCNVRNKCKTLRPRLLITDRKFFKVPNTIDSDGIKGRYFYICDKFSF